MDAHPFSIGDRVISANGHTGRVLEVVTDPFNVPHHRVTIRWDGRGKSFRDADGLTKIPDARWFGQMRKRLGLSGAQLARILNVDPRTIRKWEAEDGSTARDPNPVAVRVLEWMVNGTLDAKALAARY